uniref:Uncharacterized protein n=1 Tax=Kuenenia stuttgartiensis TaxID=174633 RepID=Q1Q6J0_KUEST|nr:unknown protein [Candidatus Kuenenia stuttgartiensis]
MQQKVSARKVKARLVGIINNAGNSVLTSAFSRPATLLRFSSFVASFTIIMQANLCASNPLSADAVR